MLSAECCCNVLTGNVLILRHHKSPKKSKHRTPEKKSKHGERDRKRERSGSSHHKSPKKKSRHH